MIFNSIKICLKISSTDFETWTYRIVIVKHCNLTFKKYYAKRVLALKISFLDKGTTGKQFYADFWNTF